MIKWLNNYLIHEYFNWFIPSKWGDFVALVLTHRLHDVSPHQWVSHFLLQLVLRSLTDDARDRQLSLHKQSATFGIELYFLCGFPYEHVRRILGQVIRYLIVKASIAVFAIVHRLDHRHLRGHIFLHIRCHLAILDWEWWETHTVSATAWELFTHLSSIHLISSTVIISIKVCRSLVKHWLRLMMLCNRLLVGAEEHALLLLHYRGRFIVVKLWHELNDVDHVKSAEKRNHELEEF